MRRLRVRVKALLALAAPAALLIAGPAAAAMLVAGPAAAAPTSGPAAVEVGVAPSAVATVLGDQFTVESRISNTGVTPTGPMLAHLNVASLTSAVYVDPEDWSSSRTREIAPLAPGAATTVSWELQAVNAGSFDVYVVLLPAAGTGPLAVSSPAHVMVAGRRTLNAGGALPVALLMPILIGLVAVADRYRVRRPIRRRDGGASMPNEPDGPPVG